jgi:hypothetical protein
MFIAILVLLGIAGAIWYFARQQTQTVTLSQEDVAASAPSFDETEAKLKEAQQAALKIDKKLDKMTKKIDEALAAVPAPEVTAPKVEVIEEPTPEEPTPVVEETYEISEEEFQSEVAAGSTEVVSEEVGDSKPVRKKKRRYYPKKK